MSKAGYALIKQFEALRLTTYRCQAGKLTIGYGHTGPDVKEGMQITEAQADALLVADVRQFEQDVTSLLKTTVTQNQFDALVSFAFNVGSDIDADILPEGLGDSTLLKLVNGNPNNTLITAEFYKWHKVRKNGVLTPSDGLMNRRVQEAKHYWK